MFFCMLSGHKKDCMHLVIGLGSSAPELRPVQHSNPIKQKHFILSIKYLTVMDWCCKCWLMWVGLTLPRRLISFSQTIYPNESLQIWVLPERCSKIIFSGCKIYTGYPFQSLTFKRFPIIPRTRILKKPYSSTYASVKVWTYNTWFILVYLKLLGKLGEIKNI